MYMHIYTDKSDAEFLNELQNVKKNSILLRSNLETEFKIEFNEKQALIIKKELSDYKEIEKKILIFNGNYLKYLYPVIDQYQNAVLEFIKGLLEENKLLPLNFMIIENHIHFTDELSHQILIMVLEHYFNLGWYECYQLNSIALLCDKFNQDKVPKLWFLNRLVESLGVATLITSFTNVLFDKLLNFIVKLILSIKKVTFGGDGGDEVFEIIEYHVNGSSLSNINNFYYYSLNKINRRKSLPKSFQIDHYNGLLESIYSNDQLKKEYGDLKANYSYIIEPLLKDCSFNLTDFINLLQVVKSISNNKKSNTPSSRYQLMAFFTFLQKMLTKSSSWAISIPIFERLVSSTIDSSLEVLYLEKMKFDTLIEIFWQSELLDTKYISSINESMVQDKSLLKAVYESSFETSLGGIHCRYKNYLVRMNKYLHNIENSPVKSNFIKPMSYMFISLFDIHTINKFIYPLLPNECDQSIMYNVKQQQFENQQQLIKYFDFTTNNNNNTTTNINIQLPTSFIQIVLKELVESFKISNYEKLQISLVSKRMFKMVSNVINNSMVVPTKFLLNQNLVECGKLQFPEINLIKKELKFISFTDKSEFLFDLDIYQLNFFKQLTSIETLCYSGDNIKSFSYIKSIFNDFKSIGKLIIKIKSSKFPLFFKVVESIKSIGGVQVQFEITSDGNHSKIPKNLNIGKLTVVGKQRLNIDLNTKNLKVIVKENYDQYYILKPTLESRSIVSNLNTIQFKFIDFNTIGCLEPQIKKYFQTSTPCLFEISLSFEKNYIINYNQEENPISLKLAENSEYSVNREPIIKLIRHLILIEFTYIQKNIELFPNLNRFIIKLKSNLYLQIWNNISMIIPNLKNINNPLFIQVYNHSLNIIEFKRVGNNYNNSEPTIDQFATPSSKRLKILKPPMMKPMDLKMIELTGHVRGYPNRKPIGLQNNFI